MSAPLSTRARLGSHDRAAGYWTGVAGFSAAALYLFAARLRCGGVAAGLTGLRFGTRIRTNAGQQTLRESPSDPLLRDLDSGAIADGGLHQPGTAGRDVGTFVSYAAPSNGHSNRQEHGARFARSDPLAGRGAGPDHSVSAGRGGLAASVALGFD